MRVFLAAALLAALPARAEFSVSPLRQVITAEAREATFEVSNPSRRIIEGRVRWLDLAATEEGYREASAAERERLSAAPFLSVAPARFRLEPGARTTVTVKLRRGRTPPRGERRSHLLFETAAARTPLRKAGGSLEVDIGLALSTPVILRDGVPSGAARIGESRLVRNAAGLLELETRIAPDGRHSVYGSIEVAMRGFEGQERLIGLIDNVAAYPDAPARKVVIPLGVSSLPASIIEARLVGRAEYDGLTLARRSFEIAAPSQPEESASESLSPSKPVIAQ